LFLLGAGKWSFWNGRDGRNRNNLFSHRETAGAEDLSASQVLAKQKVGGKIDEISENSQNQFQSISRFESTTLLFLSPDSFSNSMP
jgi:hypothetical protein